MKYNKLFSITCSIFFLIGCSEPIFQPDTHCLSVIPANYLSPNTSITWKFEYIEEKGMTIEIPISNIYEEITISVPSHLVFPLRILPVLESTTIENLIGVEAHIGMIVPTSKEINLWSSTCADIFFKIINGSQNSSPDTLLYCSYFNWAKLEKTLYKYENPYDLDLDKIAQDIAHGTFSSKSIKKLLP